MNIRDPWLIEGGVHSALLSMESGADEGHYAKLAAHADIVRRMYLSGPEHTQAETIIRMISIVMERPDRRMTKAEEVAIRAAVKVTLPAVRRAKSTQIFEASLNAMRDIGPGGEMRLTL